MTFACCCLADCVCELDGTPHHHRCWVAALDLGHCDGSPAQTWCAGCPADVRADVLEILRTNE